MVIHHRAKLCGHRHSGRGDMNILTNVLILTQMPDIGVCPLTSTIIIFSKAHGMPCSTCFSNSNLKTFLTETFFNVSNKSDLGHMLSG